MEYEIYDHRHGLTNVENQKEFKETWNEILQIISNITDQMIIDVHSEKFINTNKSLSMAINYLLKQQFKASEWSSESYIFKGNKYKNNAWRLDFAKSNISIEVAFNHSGTIAWNLMKPVLASELNHVEKAIQTKVGVIITATNEMKITGGFDSAIGTFEKYIDHLLPLNSQLTVPIIIIGLKKPKTFYIEPYKSNNNKTLGKIKYL